MSQQIELYRKLNFHKLGSPTVGGTIEMFGTGPIYKVGTPYESSTYIADGYGVGIDEGYAAAASNRIFAIHVNADTGGTDVTGDTYSGAIRGRLVIGTTQTNASLMGVVGCVDVGASKNIQGNVFGLDGVLDFYGASTAGSGAAFYAGAGRFTVWNEGTTTVGAGGVLCGIDICQNSGSPTLGSGAINPAIHIRSQANYKWAVGLHMNAAGVTKGIKIGSLSSTTAGSGVKMDATTTSVVEVHADDADTARAVGTQARAIFGRTMIYADNACEDWGVHGLSKVSGVAKTGNVSAGVVGAFESTGTCSIAAGSGNSFVAGVMGRIGGGGTFTITSGNVVGMLSFYNTSTTNAFTGTGTCAFMATASDIAGTGNWDYGLYIEDTVYGIYVNAEPTATGRIAKLSGTIAAPNHGDGYGAVEVDATFSGTVAGTSAAFSSWVNIAAAGVPGGNIICAQNNGIYLPTGITASSAKMIMGMRMQYVADDGANPGSLYCFSTNIYSNQITAIFDVNAAVDFRWVSGALTNGACNIPLFRDASAGVTYYVNCYTS